MATWKLKPKHGSHRLADGTLIDQENPIAECSEAELGGARWKFDCVVPDPPVTEGPSAARHIRRRDDGGFDVIHPATGKPINDVPLTEDDVRSMSGAGAVR